MSVLDQVPEALDLGQRLAKASGVSALARTVWQEGRVGSWNVSVGSPSAGGADLVTVSYVLSELTSEQADLLRQFAASRGEETPAPKFQPVNQGLLGKLRQAWKG